MANCMVCGQPAPTVNRFVRGCWVECNRCGKFETDDTFADMAQREDYLDVETRRILSGIIRQATDRLDRMQGKIRLEGDGNYEALIGTSQYPRNALEQAETALMALVAASKHLGAQLKIDNSEPWIARCFLSTSGQWGQLVEEMVQIEWVRRDKVGGLIVTAEGWKVAEKARQRVRVPERAFVAMWFTPLLHSAFTNGMAPALEECGFKPPFIVPDSQSDRKIDDEIVAMLRQSSLAVIDLTGSRPSVYYEAGIAHGLGMPVIFTCAREITHWRLDWDPASEKDAVAAAFASWDQAPAFDIRQYPVVDWGAADELKRKLSARIRARGWEAKPRSQ